MPVIQAHKSSILLILLFSFSSLIEAADTAAGKEKAGICLGCHGTNGNSKVAIYPSLAGQRTTYLSNQLTAFKSKSRSNPIMEGIAANLTQTDISNLAAYFSSLPAESAGSNSSLAAAGQAKFTMCSGCHGASGQGRGTFPKLAGQQPAYLEKQLLSFKNRSRKGGPMNAITSSLSDQDIKEIAAYLGSL